ncbi:RNA polymerase III transcription factor (TF)IIIC subunit [Teratosphaeria destructans]|uniref:RNA polymerase III transcription factor (TF)IIIC subunit n=1 Tax=Teratosphaeria destructans TaxID=418781 RepID=A0A9W7SWV3_9PEZI|nr:RNA polymerase III transcription factor (TF)IIIC subunit [Teratosphaeria destructans]
MARDQASPPARPTAPTYSVPNKRIVSIEHPCIIKNFDNGFKSLGGEPMLKHAIQHRVGDSKIKTDDKMASVEPTVGASLRPNDPTAKKIESTGILTRNVLVKVTLPKRTGRKRKRGSDEPFIEDPLSRSSPGTMKAPDLLQRLRESGGQFSIEPVGMVPETHRFRRQPDYQLRTDDMPVFRQLEKPLSNLSYSVLKDFNIDLEPGPTRGVAYPMPMDFTQYQQPLPYEYRQAAGVNYGYDDNGNPISFSTSWKHGKTAEATVADAKEVPSGPPPGWVGRSKELSVARCAEDLGGLLEKRPLVTARVAVNTMKIHKPAAIKDAIPTVGYMFTNGAWRDVIIKYGVDPRSDPKYRFYQPFMFQLDGERIPGKGTNNDTARISLHKAKIWDSHIFDGTVMRTDGRTWQACDITDPILYDLLHKPEAVAEKCSVDMWGWYKPGVISKVRTIMKDKIRYLQKGETPPEEDYGVVRDAPEDTDGLAAIDAKKLAQAGCNEHQVELMRQYRILLVQSKYQEREAAQALHEGMGSKETASSRSAAVAPKANGVNEGRGEQELDGRETASMSDRNHGAADAMIDPRLLEGTDTEQDNSLVSGSLAVQSVNDVQAQRSGEGRAEVEPVVDGGEDAEDGLFVT